MELKMQKSRELRKKENNPVIIWNKPKKQKELKDFINNISKRNGGENQGK